MQDFILTQVHFFSGLSFEHQYMPLYTLTIAQLICMPEGMSKIYSVTEVYTYMYKKYGEKLLLYMKHNSKWEKEQKMAHILWCVLLLQSEDPIVHSLEICCFKEGIELELWISKVWSRIKCCQ
jgi:hypothetical protein